MFARRLHERRFITRRPVHNVLLKRLFSQKAVIWRKLRGTEQGTIRARVLQSHYKALCVRINSTVLL